MKLQTIIMTSDKSAYTLRPFIHLWQRYFKSSFHQENIICGFTPPEFDLHGFKFYSIGKQDSYPAHRWSNAFINTLDHVADEIFILMLDDYWLVRQTDALAIQMIYDYMNQFQNVIKFDLTTERLFADGGGKYNFGYNTYNTLGYLDLIKSSPASPYHLSLWGGIWRRDLLRQFIVPGESAQQIEINGTSRLSQAGDEVLVLGTRQSPIRHANVIQRGKWNQDPMTGVPALNETDREDCQTWLHS